MLPPAALLAASLFASITGPVCPNPYVTTPSEWIPNPGASVASCPASSAASPLLHPVAQRSLIADAGADTASEGSPAPNRSSGQKPQVSVGDYTTQAQLSTASFIRPGDMVNTAQATDLTPDEAALLADINLDRAARGLSPLNPDPLLVEIARTHSEDMCRRNYFDHIAPAPGPSSPMDRYLAALDQRPDYAMVGENIYYRSVTDSLLQSATEANDAFMHSPGHRANILQPLYTRVGVGIYRNPQTGEFWVTEMFLTVSQPK